MNTKIHTVTNAHSQIYAHAHMAMMLPQCIFVLLRERNPMRFLKDVIYQYTTAKLFQYLRNEEATKI